MRSIIRLVRPKQWTKNTLVFAALIFSQHYTNPTDLLRSLVAFVVFSAVASGIYVINDLLDVEADRRHPVKKNRPIASGSVSPPFAIVFATILLAAGLSVGWLLGLSAFLTLALYAVVMVLYSLRLKHILLLDVFIIAGGLTARAVLGAEVLSVAISQWLLVCTFFIALMLALVKRRQELARIGEEREKGRKSLLTAPDIRIWDLWIAMVAGVTILAYTLYTMDPVTITKIGSDKLIFTVPFVAFAIFRYQIAVYADDKGEDPTDTLLNDPWIIATVLAWLAVVLWVMVTGDGSLDG